MRDACFTWNIGAAGDGGELTIVTSRLLLRSMRAADAEPLLGIFGDPVVMEVFGVPPFGDGEMERWVARNLEHQRRYGVGLFSVIRRDDGLLVGDCGLEIQDDGSGDIEVGYDLRSDCWGRGYATEAAGAVVVCAESLLARSHEGDGLPGIELPRGGRLISLIRHRNERSRRVAEKIGMHHEADVTRYGATYWRFARSRIA